MLRLHFSLLLLSATSIAWTTLNAEGVHSDAECSALVDAFLERRFPQLKIHSSNKAFVEYNEDDFLFFLHVPRTAGRSFWSCFLYVAYPPSEKCAKSYDSLRLELSRPDCKLLASHDDYSITDYLPDNYKVITQARDPVDRVISAYEFAAVVAARDFSPNITKTPDRSDKVKTRDVWPWIYLIQFFDRYIERSLGLLYKKQSLFKQKNKKAYEQSLDRWVESISLKSGKTYYFHRKTRESKWTLEEDEKQKLLPMLDPYNNSLLVPLAAFIEFPMVEELVNNAMTYQVLGLSNVSYWEEAADIRSCSVHSQTAQEKLLAAAKSQMDGMLHISLTHKLDESLQSIAATLKLGLRSPTWAGVPTMLQGGNVTETNVSLDEHGHDLSKLSDGQLMQLLFKYRTWMDESREIARSKRRSNLTRTEFLPKWDAAVANLESVRVIQAEVMKRRKVKGENLTQYPEKANDRKKEKAPLWRAYQRCVRNSTRKMANGKIRSMTNLAFPDERRPYFTKKARVNIPRSTIDAIKEKNWMDMQLYEYAVERYNKYLEHQRNNGLLEDIPVFPINSSQTEPPDPPEPIFHDEL